MIFECLDVCREGEERRCIAQSFISGRIKYGMLLQIISASWTLSFHIRLRSAHWRCGLILCGVFPGLEALQEQLEIREELDPSWKVGRARKVH